MTKAQTAAEKYLEHGYSPIPLVSGRSAHYLRTGLNTRTAL